MPVRTGLSVTDSRGSASISFEYDGQRRVTSATLNSTGGTRTFGMAGSGKSWSVQRTGPVVNETVSVADRAWRLETDLSMPFAVQIA